MLLKFIQDIAIEVKKIMSATKVVAKTGGMCNTATIHDEPLMCDSYTIRLRFSCLRVQMSRSFTLDSEFPLTSSVGLAWFFNFLIVKMGVNTYLTTRHVPSTQ